MDKQRVLVLGSTGMLGSMVYSYLKNHSEFEVTGTARNQNKEFEEFDASLFTLKSEYSVDFNNFDYVLNCIGIIKPFCKDDDSTGVKNAIVVNSLFPRVLSEKTADKTKIIQIATDCVYSGKEGAYKEDAPHDALDAYGKSKSMGEVQADNFLNIRCSIIGPEKKNHVSLLEWFLKQDANAELKGFTHHSWNGVTTLQFAKLMEKIISGNHFDSLKKTSSTHHFVPNSTVDKFQLLNIFQDVFGTNYSIEPVDNIGPPVKRDIGSNLSDLEKIYPSIEMKAAIQELKEHLDRGTY